MLIEVWSDVVCPWCYIGKRRLEKALAEFPHAADVEVVWRSFQLDPSYAKGQVTPVYEYLANKFGGSPRQAKGMTEQVTAGAAGEGLAFGFGRAHVVNTYDAHRVTHLAKAHGLGPEAHERFLHAHFAEGATLNDPDTLARLAVEVGVPEAEVRRVLASDEYSGDVDADIRDARTLGASGVPFFVLDRAFGISGAQPVETFLTALQRAYDHAAASPAR
ncbi:DsbA family oxidoreductase [Micromonospora sp. CPCC 205371]|nr:DsbA family oxidoreductase [Micromonospora sp. CPCC 205371]